MTRRIPQRDVYKRQIRGRSSGGFTVLNALASSDVFTAGASFSGIADLVKLKETSHKFESHYDAILLGTDAVSYTHLLADRSHARPDLRRSRRLIPRL